MRKSLLDKVIETVNPAAAFERYRKRAAIEILERKYEGAAKGRRTGDWKTSGASANMEVNVALKTLRDRSRYLVRNNGEAKNAIGRIVPNNVVGTGILPTPKYVGNGAKKINQTVKDRWKAWADKIKCDYDGNLNLYGLQHLAWKAVAESGECLIRRIYTSAKNDVPLELQVLEADFIDTTKHDLAWSQDGKERNYYGIRFNNKGKRIGYWIYKSHPVEFGFMESTLVPAEDIIHLYEVERPGQIRGIPFSSASMIKIRDLDKYEDAELIRQQIAACFTVFITEDDPDNQSDKGSNEQLEKVEPGIIEHLAPGKQVHFANPPLTQGYDSYTGGVKRSISSGIGVTYESMTGDFSKVNFSSAKMGLNEFQNNVNHWQWNIMIPKFCETVFEWFLEACSLKGYIPVGTMVPVTWTPPRRQLIDPLKEINGMKEAVRAGFQSKQSVIKELGQDPDEVLQEQKDDLDKDNQAGLKPSSNPVFDKMNQPDTTGKEPVEKE